MSITDYKQKWREREIRTLMSLGKTYEEAIEILNHPIDFDDKNVDFEVDSAPFDLAEFLEGATSYCVIGGTPFSQLQQELMDKGYTEQEAIEILEKSENKRVQKRGFNHGNKFGV